MLKKVLAVAGCLVIVALMATPVLAQAQAPETAADKEAAAKLALAVAVEVSKGQQMMYMGLAIGLGMGIAALGGAFGQGKAIAAAVDAVARQPEAGGRIQTMMIIGLALIETLVIYMLLVCFLFMPQ